ncbi:MAG: SCP2 domain-containing protein [Granulosicoccus sp.]
MSVPLPLQFAIEKGVEALLSLDPDTRQRVNAIDGKVVKFCVSSPPFAVALSVVDGKAFVVGGDDEQADTTISGSLQALRSLTQGNDALYRGEVFIEGDIGLGQTLKEIAGGLDPDWEELLSHFVGDSVAHHLGVQGNRFSDWFARTESAFKQNSSEYLQEEAEVVAANSQVRKFCAEVDELRAASDRLDARLRRLSMRATDQSGESD